MWRSTANEIIAIKQKNKRGCIFIYEISSCPYLENWSFSRSLEGKDAWETLYTSWIQNLPLCTYYLHLFRWIITFSHELKWVQIAIEKSKTKSSIPRKSPSPTGGGGFSKWARPLLLLPPPDFTTMIKQSPIYNSPPPYTHTYEAGFKNLPKSIFTGLMETSAN